MGKNAELNLPVGKMERVIIAFDVDGTLIDGDIVYDDIVAMLNTLNRFKNVRVVVWSGGGKQYAETIGRRLGLKGVAYTSKFEHEALRDNGYTIIAIDDIQDTAIGDVNLIVRNK
jgi:phosphoserine phosphatase